MKSDCILREARASLFKDQDLTIRCLNGGLISVSRLLFALLLKAELRTELLKDEHTYLIMDHLNVDQVTSLFNDAFYSRGQISREIIESFPFVNWDLFKTTAACQQSVEPESLSEKSSQEQQQQQQQLQSPVECSICGKSLSDKKTLKKHADVVHFNIRKYFCDNCGKRFISICHLKDHVRNVHDKVKAFVCEMCGQALSTRHGLRQHKLIHKEGTKSITCPRCNKTFRHLSTYRKHIARVHDFTPDKRLTCDSCGKLFNHSEGLKRHIKKFHAQNKPEYQCDLCPLAFVFNYDLNKHKKRTHQQ